MAKRRDEMRSFARIAPDGARRQFHDLGNRIDQRIIPHAHGLGIRTLRNESAIMGRQHVRIERLAHFIERGRIVRIACEIDHGIRVLVHVIEFLLPACRARSFPADR